VRVREKGSVTVSDDIGSNIEGEMEAQSVILRDEMVEIETVGIMKLQCTNSIVERESDNLNEKY